MAATFTIDPSLEEFNIPLATLQTRADNVGKRLVIGVAIARTSPTTKVEVLLLQRAAHESLYPNMYELPGGKVEDTLDGTLLDTVVRETLEETGMRVVRLRAQFAGFEYATPKYNARQFNFLVEVDQGDGAVVNLAPEEHQAFAWTNESTYEAYPMSDSMKVVVADALKTATSVYGAPAPAPSVGDA